MGTSLKDTVLDYLYLVQARINKDVPSPDNFINKCKLKRYAVYEYVCDSKRLISLGDTYDCKFPENQHTKTHICYHTESNQLLYTIIDQIFSIKMELFQRLFHKYGIQIIDYDSGFEVLHRESDSYRDYEHNHLFYHAISFDPDVKGIEFDSVEYSIGDIIDLIGKDTFAEHSDSLSRLLDHVHNYFMGFVCAMDLIWIPWKRDLGEIADNLTKYYKSIKHLLYVDSIKIEPVWE